MTHKKKLDKLLLINLKDKKLLLNRIRNRITNINSQNCEEISCKHRYPNLFVANIPYRINRLICYLENPIANPENFVAMHTCDNPKCVNSDHISWGTSRDNTRDMWNKKRNKSPVTGRDSLLFTEEQLKEIKGVAPYVTLDVLHSKFNWVSKKSLRTIVSRLGVNCISISGWVAPSPYSWCDMACEKYPALKQFLLSNSTKYRFNELQRLLGLNNTTLRNNLNYLGINCKPKKRVITEEDYPRLLELKKTKTTKEIMSIFEACKSSVEKHLVKARKLAV